MQIQKRSTKAGLAVAVVAISLSGCNSARLDQFSTFAEAGKTYTASVPPMLDLSLQAAFDSNSNLVVEYRRRLKTEDKRLEYLGVQDGRLIERKRIFDRIVKQSGLLGQYFAAIDKLATTDAGDGIAKSATDAAKALAAVSDKFKQAPSITGGLAKLAVGSFQRAKLEAVLKATERSIRISLAIHKELVEEVRGQLDTDLTSIRQTKMSRLVIDPYVQGRKLPETWSTDRRELILAEANVEALSVAAKAIGKLQRAFEDLVRNEASDVNLQLLLSDLKELGDLAGKLAKL